MPRLVWESKAPLEPPPAILSTDSVVYPGGSGYPDGEAFGRLIWGDNLATMAALMPELEGRVNLIYTDPPFFTNRRYLARVGRGEDSRRPKEWKLTEGYPDSWPDLDSYLDMLYPRLALMHRLLAPNGSLYLHLDWHANAYARLLLDEIFGADRLLNEIVWVYHGPSPIRRAFNRKHDTILIYTKGDNYTFNVDAVRTPYDPSTVKTFASSPKAGFGKIPDLERGKVPEDWWYYPVVARLHNERTGYPTQKPESLVERVVQASSNPGDLVADFFCGSGTLGEVCSRLDRRYLLVDANWRAAHTAYARLASPGKVPFTLERASLSDESDNEESSPAMGMPRSGFNVTQRAGQLVVSVSPELAERLDYWEVDPCWNGKVFCSAAQAQRPLRRDRIARELSVPQAWVGKIIRVRYVEIDGKRSSVNLPHG